MRLCGIDSSSKFTSISLFIDGELDSYKLIDCHKIKDSNDRVNQMMKDIWTCLNEYKPNVIYQEYTWVSKNPKTALLLTNILGGVRMWAIVNKSDWHKIEPSAWRAQLGLNKYLAERPELKDKSISFIKEKYGIEPETDDVSDSICIGLAGLKIYES